MVTPEIKAVAHGLTDEQWLSGEQWMSALARSGPPADAPGVLGAAGLFSGEWAEILVYVREIADGLTESQARRLCEFANGFGFGGRGGGVVLRSLEAKHLARPAGRENLSVEVLPLGRAVLRVSEESC